jgi:hypothetical protein
VSIQSRIGTAPARNFDGRAARDGRNGSTVEPKFTISAFFSLKLLACNCNVAVLARDKDGRSIDGSNKDLAVYAVGAIKIGGIIQEVYTAIC